MTALDTIAFFDAGAGANVTEATWRQAMRHLSGSGVIDGVGSEFAVTERGAGANLSVDVASGETWIRGHWGESTGTKNKALSAAHATLARIDRVVLRADFTANTITIEVLEGTAHASPTAPTLTQSSSRWEISLAQISVPATDTTIANAQITDERTIIAHPLVDMSPAPSNGDGLVYNSTTGLWEPGSSGTGLASASAVRTAADVTINSTGNFTADVDTGLDLAVAAVAGDRIALTLSGGWGNEATTGRLNWVTRVAGADVNFVYPAAGKGPTAFWGPSTVYMPIGGTVYYTVQAGDLSGGNVTFRLRAKTDTATNKVLLASTGNGPLEVGAVNLGQ